ncbi:MAG: DUF924 domain-containing protein [Alphaproteobacteria bacterium]|nr:DUF924 domain-containing protein [Alphaproteobacteria bacterium]
MINEVLDFWCTQCGPEDWFAKSAALDAAIRDGFSRLHQNLCDYPDQAWTMAETPLGALAVVIVLDQFSRNLYRESAKAFAADPFAREVARYAIARGFHTDPGLPTLSELFFYLPFEHSESLADQDWSCALIASMGNENYGEYAQQHRNIIARFGRFPHRNAVLGRTSTPEERDFLTQPGSSF